MVRATRSTAALQSQHNATAQLPQSLPKRRGRKRKRVSTSTDLIEDQPVSKQQRRVEAKLDEEHSRPGVADLPLDSEDARKILDILEIIDTQGLLDRVFPFPEGDASSSKASTSKDTIKHHSLRSLLQDPTSHTLRVIRAAIYPLFPISSHPRSRPSIPAAQQLHFCSLALSLLDQSSQAHPKIALSQSTIFTEADDSDSAGEPSERQRKYALVQRLPEGEWWSSLNSIREGENGLLSSEVKDMRRGYAELTSVIPTLPLQPGSMSTLGELLMENRKESRLRFRPLCMHPRQLATGSFLDYGPYTSFAPSFDSEGAEVGQSGLNDVFRGKSERRRIKESRRKLLEKLRREHDEEGSRVESEIVPSNERCVEMDEILESLFPGEKSNGFKDVIWILQTEEGVSRLLERNARSLERLNMLQFTRLREGFTPVEEGTEEWQLAQAIMQSLILLSSLRPRLFGTDIEQATLIPPPSVLRALRSSLPVAPTQGWQGTLDEARKTALRDDTTVRVESGATVSTQQTAVVQAIVPAYTPPLYPTNAQYRSSPSAYAYQPPPVQTRQTTQTSSIVPANFYQNTFQQTGNPQYQYYSQWYNYQTTAGQKGTPAANMYGNYASAVTPKPIGNTAKQQNGWSQGYLTSAPTVLPAHLRRTASTTPGTPTYSPYHPYIPTQPTG